MEYINNYNIFISTGYYSTLMAACLVEQLGLKSNVLIIENNKQNYQSNIELAEKLGVFDKIHYFQIYSSARHLIKLYPCINNCFLPYFEYKYWSWYSKAKEINFYDEGSSSYCNSKIYQGNKQVREAPHYFLTCKYSYDIKNSHLINKEIFLKNLQKTLLSQDTLLPNSIVFLSNLHIFNDDTKDKNLAIYSKIILLIIQKLNLNVYYKAHPRENSCYDKLKDLLPKEYRNRFYLLETINPTIDYIFLNNKANIKFIIGDFSTALINSYEVFSIPSFAIKSPVYPFNQLREIIQYFIPDINDLLSVIKPKSEDIIKTYENYISKVNAKIQVGNYTYINNIVIEYLSAYYIKRKSKTNFFKKLIKIFLKN